PTQPRLIPIVSTAETRDAVALAQLYLARWPQQENVTAIGCCRLGWIPTTGMPRPKWSTRKLPSNGPRSTSAITPSSAGSRAREQRAGKRYHKLQQQIKARANALYRALNHQQDKLRDRGVDPELCRIEVKARQRLADAEIRALERRANRAYTENSTEFRKLER